jgi:hypothetical protein
VEDNNMRALRRLPFTLIISVILIFITAFCITGTVNSQSSCTGRIDEEYYREMESTYLKELRGMLTDRGYENCGITMTYVTDEDRRTYTVVIHHRKINKLSVKEKQELMADCAEIQFQDETCGIFHKFLEEDL